MSNGGGYRYARFIPDEEIGRSTKWDFVAVDERARLAAEEALRLKEAQAAENQPSYLQRIQDAYEAGRRMGHEDGLAEGLREGNEKLDAYVQGEAQAAGERLAGLSSSMADCLVAAQERIGAQVLEMAVALARQVVRRELAIDPQALLPVVREALGQLIADGRPATVRLNPQDLEELRATLQKEHAGSPIAWVADGGITAGGCQVDSAGAVVDGRLETRWNRAVASLGLERAWAQPQADAEEPDEAAG